VRRPSEHGVEKLGPRGSHLRPHQGHHAVDPAFEMGDHIAGDVLLRHLDLEGVQRLGLAGDLNLHCRHVDGERAQRSRLSRLQLRRDPVSALDEADEEQCECEEAAPGQGIGVEERRYP